jgi:hypothetical protein
MAIRLRRRLLRRQSLKLTKGSAAAATLTATMSHGRGQFSDGERTRLRQVVDAIDRELSCLGREATAEAHRSSMSSLLASWEEMLTLLALGPIPETRVCPGCRNVGRRAATRCGYCWAELGPTAPAIG